MPSLISISVPARKHPAHPPHPHPAPPPPPLIHRQILTNAQFMFCGEHCPFVPHHPFVCHGNVGFEHNLAHHPLYSIYPALHSAGGRYVQYEYL